MTSSEQNKANNNISDASDFLNGDLTETYLNDTELDMIVGGMSLKAGGGVQAKSETVLGCWPDCTVAISGCRKITT